MISGLPHIALTAGDPAGIGPDIVVAALADRSAALLPAVITVMGDPEVLAARANALGLDLKCLILSAGDNRTPHQPGRIVVDPVSCASDVTPGQLNAANSAAVIESINRATDACLSTTCDAMTTAPVHKAIINDAGIAFSGHTEWIADRAGAQLPVMMLANQSLRVCLATTHLPLSAVPAAITDVSLRSVLEIVARDVSKLYGIRQPVIGVCGLNPHAGEGGYLGREEIEVIGPVIETLRAAGMNLIGPLPADTAFTQSQLAKLDVVVAMYHDQGLPVIKHQGFGEVVNVTLGLPLIRTSVDHGTALDLAATGDASATSMVAAINLAIEFACNQAPAGNDP